MVKMKTARPGNLRDEFIPFVWRVRLHQLAVAMLHFQIEAQMPDKLELLEPRLMLGQELIAVGYHKLVSQPHRDEIAYVHRLFCPGLCDHLLNNRIGFLDYDGSGVRVWPPGRWTAIHVGVAVEIVLLLRPQKRRKNKHS